MLSTELHLTDSKLEALFFFCNLGSQLALLQALAVAVQPEPAADCLLTGCVENSITRKVARLWR